MNFRFLLLGLTFLCSISSVHASVVTTDTVFYSINPSACFAKPFQGWGISLCWWANMCGKWSDANINQLIDWLASPRNLNYRFFRYNIGGGDDPLNRNCTLHHMGNGKGLRAEMEGFKDSANAPYNWSRDAAQRKVLLKIKEKRPDAVFEAFSNSCPYYMTNSGCCAGSVNGSDDNLRADCYADFAHYLVDVCKFYKDSFDITFHSLEPFNEPVTNYWKANGSQEGCHVGVASQIAFLKVLAPVLKESGLSTVISACDESSVDQSLSDLKGYLSDSKALSIISQWNTHTYGGSDKSRANVRALITANGKSLWMSEVGSGGSGLEGNLTMAKHLIEDIRYLHPEVWTDWQYVEEWNDQWCLVRGSFANQTYYRVKNYFVRFQFSHYIVPGSTFLEVPSDNMLAALSPTGDSLVIVALNNTDNAISHFAGLRYFKIRKDGIECTRTSSNESAAKATDFELDGNCLKMVLPARSLTTWVCPIEAIQKVPAIQSNATYLIVPRIAALAMTANKDHTVSIEEYQLSDSSQLWKLIPATNGYNLKNLAGWTLTDSGSYLSSVAQVPVSGQTVTLESVGDESYKIKSVSSGNVLDLKGESNSAGTQVGWYNYGTSPAASHRQWMLLLPPSANNVEPDLVSSMLAEQSKPRIVSTEGGVTFLQPDGQVTNIGVYNVLGKCVMQCRMDKSLSFVSLKPGIYIMRLQTTNGALSAHKIVVK